MKKLYLIVFIFYSSITFGQNITPIQKNYNFDGINRQFNLYIPDNYNASADTIPLVFFLHGMGGNMSNFGGLSYKANSENYIMVVPQALADPNFGTTWHSGAGVLGIYPNANIDDLGFLNSLIDSVSTWYNVDEDRVYSTGFSMGGFMTNRLGCELGDRIAAIASVAGTIGNEIVNACNPDNIIPSLHIHSTTDQTVAYTNNTFGNDAEELVEFWVNNNNCAGTIDTTNLSNAANDGNTAVKYLYNGGDLNSEVEFYRLTGPAHNESFYTTTSNNDFDAIEVIWDFFSRHENKKTIPIIEPEPNAITNINLAKFDAFPNPASQKITLNFETKVELASISIANTLGKIIDSITFDQAIDESVFDVSDRAPGIYFFQIKDIEGNMTVMRFFKK